MDMLFEQIQLEPRSLEQFLSIHSDRLILVSKGHADYTTKKSSYNAVLIYKGNKSDVVTEHFQDVTSNRCALLGYISLAKKIKKSLDVIIVSDTSLGFKKCLKGSGVNKDLCVEVLNELEKAGVKNVIEVIVKGGSDKLKSYLMCEEERKEENKKEYRSIVVNMPKDKYEKLLDRIKRMKTTVNKVMNDYIDEYLDED